MYYLKLLTLILGVVFLLHGCAKETNQKPQFPQDRIDQQRSSEQMVLVDQPFTDFFKGDDLSEKTLHDAIGQSLVYLNRIPASRTFNYGKLKYTAEELILSFKLFQELLAQSNDKEQFIRQLEEKFYLFQSASNPGDQVLYTGYYEPIFQGSLTPSAEYNVAVYRKPSDLEVLQLGEFRKSLKNRTIVFRNQAGQVVPYFSRRQIMADKILAERNLEIAWMKDPVDLFFLQVQGSGILALPDGRRIKLSYNGANGHNYSSIGKLLLDEGKMELEEISMGSIRQYMVDHPQERDRILYHNQSYTFFGLGEAGKAPRGNINVPLTPLRSVATDASIFPKSGLAYIVTEVPIFDSQGQANGKKAISRFVLNQDTGGAIKGTGRVDLFWGNGEIAEKSAGSLRSFGRIYFLVAKKVALQRYAAQGSTSLTMSE
ncbi:MAG: transglycosylase [SAR324 cluster bacterium]|uniref:peptidoglycan lytic exotransglycosylase n=1 Tax=SAR324 cluster bacterium TaxID=2024889 RepID=A0A2A4T109_9DELT|nr:MAG: transglycosylase [SAR324 cluster bacterium]